MKRLSSGVLAALIATLCGLSAVAVPAIASTHGNIGNGVAQTGDLRRLISEVRRRARFRFSTTITTFTASLTFSNKAAFLRRSSRAERS